MKDAIEQVIAETERAQWSCDECEGYFSEGLPNIMDDGEFLCDDCLDEMISRHAPDCE